MKQNAQTRSISMEAWCAMARENAAPPVTIVLEGDSMRPLIRRGRDTVTVVPLQREPMVGDVVLFSLGTRYIVHRVCRMKDGMVQTFGDNCLYPDPWIPENQVLGQVVRYSRNGRVHRLDTPAARAWGKMWMTIHPIRLCYKRLRAFAGRCYRRIFPNRPERR